MNFYLIAHPHRKNSQEILRMLHEAVMRLYPDIKMEPTLSLACHDVPQALLQRESTGEFIWARFFIETLSHAALEKVEDEHRQIQNALKNLKGSEPGLKAFIFFPSLSKGVAGYFPLLGDDWCFFEYSLLQSGDEEGLALREYRVEESQNSEKEIDLTLNSESPAELGKCFFKRNVLSRGELEELIEISLEIRQMASA